MHGRHCTTTTQPNNPDLKYWLNAEFFPGPWASGLWGVGFRINFECGLSQLIYNQGYKCLLFWNLWCSVRFFVFHKYFPKTLNIIITKPFYSGANRMNIFSIVTTLPSFHLSNFWVHDKFIKYFWDHSNFWETILNFSDFPHDWILSLIKVQ